MDRVARRKRKRTSSGNSHQILLLHSNNEEPKNKPSQIMFHTGKEVKIFIPLYILIIATLTLILLEGNRSSVLVEGGKSKSSKSKTTVIAINGGGGGSEHPMHPIPVPWPIIHCHHHHHHMKYVPKPVLVHHWVKKLQPYETEASHQHEQHQHQHQSPFPAAEAHNYPTLQYQQAQSNHHQSPLIHNHHSQHDNNHQQIRQQQKHQVYNFDQIVQYPSQFENQFSQVRESNQQRQEQVMTPSSSNQNNQKAFQLSPKLRAHLESEIKKMREDNRGQPPTRQQIDRFVSHAIKSGLLKDQSGQKPKAFDEHENETDDTFKHMSFATEIPAEINKISQKTLNNSTPVTNHPESAASGTDLGSFESNRSYTNSNATESHALLVNGYHSTGETTANANGFISGPHYVNTKPSFPYDNVHDQIIDESRINLDQTNRLEQLEAQKAFEQVSLEQANRIRSMQSANQFANLAQQQQHFNNLRGHTFMQNGVVNPKTQQQLPIPLVNPSDLATKIRRFHEVAPGTISDGNLVRESRAIEIMTKLAEQLANVQANRNIIRLNLQNKQVANKKQQQQPQKAKKEMVDTNVNVNGNDNEIETDEKGPKVFVIDPTSNSIVDSNGKSVVDSGDKETKGDGKGSGRGNLISWPSFWKNSSSKQRRHSMQSSGLMTMQKSNSNDIQRKSYRDLLYQLPRQQPMASTISSKLTSNVMLRYPAIASVPAHVTVEQPQFQQQQHTTTSALLPNNNASPSMFVASYMRQNQQHPIQLSAEQLGAMASSASVQTVDPSTRYQVDSDKTTYQSRQTDKNKPGSGQKIKASENSRVVSNPRGNIKSTASANVTSIPPARTATKQPAIDQLPSTSSTDAQNPADSVETSERPNPSADEITNWIQEQIAAASGSKQATSTNPNVPISYDQFQMQSQHQFAEPNQLAPLGADGSWPSASEMPLPVNEVMASEIAGDSQKLPQSYLEFPLTPQQWSAEAYKTFNSKPFIEDQVGSINSAASDTFTVQPGGPSPQLLDQSESTRMLKTSPQFNGNNPLSWEANQFGPNLGGSNSLGFDPTGEMNQLRQFHSGLSQTLTPVSSYASNNYLSGYSSQQNNATALMGAMNQLRDQVNSLQNRLPAPSAPNIPNIPQPPQIPNLPMPPPGLMQMAGLALPFAMARATRQNNRFRNQQVQGAANAGGTTQGRGQQFLVRALTWTNRILSQRGPRGNKNKQQQSLSGGGSSSNLQQPNHRRRRLMLPNVIQTVIDLSQVQRRPGSAAGSSPSRRLIRPKVDQAVASAVASVALAGEPRADFGNIDRFSTNLDWGARLSGIMQNVPRRQSPTNSNQQQPQTHTIIYKDDPLVRAPLRPLLAVNNDGRLIRFGSMTSPVDNPAANAKLFNGRLSLSMHHPPATQQTHNYMMLASNDHRPSYVQPDPASFSTKINHNQLGRWQTMQHQPLQQHRMIDYNRNHSSRPNQTLSNNHQYQQQLQENSAASNNMESQSKLAPAQGPLVANHINLLLFAAQNVTNGATGQLTTPEPQQTQLQQQIPSQDEAATTTQIMEDSLNNAKQPELIASEPNDQHRLQHLQTAGESQEGQYQTSTEPTIITKDDQNSQQQQLEQSQREEISRAELLEHQAGSSEINEEQSVRENSIPDDVIVVNEDRDQIRKLAKSSAVNTDQQRLDRVSRHSPRSNGINLIPARSLGIRKPQEGPTILITTTAPPSLSIDPEFSKAMSMDTTTTSSTTTTGKPALVNRTTTQKDSFMQITEPMSAASQLAGVRVSANGLTGRLQTKGFPTGRIKTINRVTGQESAV